MSTSPSRHHLPGRNSQHQRAAHPAQDPEQKPRKPCSNARNAALCSTQQNWTGPSHVDGLVVCGQGGLLDGLAHGGVPVAGSSNVLGAPAILHGQHDLGNELTCADPGLSPPCHTELLAQLLPCMEQCQDVQAMADSEEDRPA